MRNRPAPKNDRWPQPVVAATVTVDSNYGHWPCPECGDSRRKTYRGESCFDCSQKRNPFLKGINFSVDATGEDSTNPDRIKDGTHDINVALPGEYVYGDRNAYGQRKCIGVKPVGHNEIASARRLKERAKRHNLTPLETQKRAIGGRSR